ncbi:ABC transporter permease [Rhabdothermincola sediminis]|uniref:ABC transporter permease n=1 Tax=Rhabdothermincola sediminis TaxID=2751370 RepID=UPI001AA0444C|nr:ABC transporter permease [Rhabdothermincola sediminis]
MNAYRMQVRTELMLSLRQGEQLLVSIGIPLLILVFFSLTGVLPIPEGFARAVDFLAPGVLALAIMSSAMVSLGIGTGFERQYGVLKRLGATPLGRGRLVAAKISMVLVLELIQVVVLVTAALALGWRPSGSVTATLPAFVLGTAAFAGLGLLLAGTLGGTVNLAATNGLYLLLLLLGGMVVPVDRLPSGVRAIAEVLPAAALSETVLGAFSAAATASTKAWAVLAAWAIAMPLVAARSFRWE